MNESRMKCALTALQWTLGIVILIEAILFLLPAAGHNFSRTHLPEIVRQILGWGEIAGAILMLIPRTIVRGAWLLAIIFVLAIVIHLLHGMYNVGNLAIYAAAACTIAIGKE
jgi:hypothetical protein